VDWDRYLGDAPKRPYDAKRFFRWRNYRDYGTGVAGDLFIHLISGIHFITGSLGPKRIFATGALSYWKDGRDVPDVMTGVIEYPKTDKLPAFQLAIKVNFASGEGDKSVLKFIGSEGVMDLSGDGIKLTQDKLPKAPGFGGWDSFNTFPEATQKEFEQAYNQKWSASDKATPENKTINYEPPKGSDSDYDHHLNFYDGIRTGKKIVEDACFGLRAAGPALACNESYFSGKVINWDPVGMKVV
jgi:predicted dehydrogenase